MEVKIDYKKLIKASINSQKNSYSPYSNFKVGASVLCDSGKIYSGANIENSSYPAGICAERVALSKAISEGETKFVAIAISCSGNNYPYPCGICRQFMAEFDKDIKIIVAKTENDFTEYTLSKLLPHSFNNKNLK